MFFGLDFFSKWKPTVEEFTATLSAPKPFLCNLDALPKGIDNAHVDVFLSTSLVEAAGALTHMLIQHDVNQYLSLERMQWPGSREIEAFQQAYAGVMETGLRMARESAHYELAQFAVLKFLLVQIGTEIEQFRSSLKQKTSLDTQMQDRRLAGLSREIPAIHHRVASRLFDHVLNVESTSLRKLRESRLGRSWPVPRQALFNPILLLPSLWNEELVMRNYTLLGVHRENLWEFAQINRVITGVFADYLPAWVQPAAAKAHAQDAGLSVRPRTDQGCLAGFLDAELLLSRSLREQEYLVGVTSWLDDPVNLDRVLRPNVGLVVQGPGERNSQLAIMPPDNKNRLAFRARLIQEAESRFKSRGLLAKICAAHEAPALFDELRHQVPVRMIYEYLEGDVSRARMKTRLASLKNNLDIDATLKRLDTGQTVVRRMSPSMRQQYVVDFMVRFVRLRRDLKLAYLTYRLMNQIRILDEPAHIELARRNRTLHELLVPEEMPPERQDIRNHVILKADLRGSSKITRELRERKLNPATHFSLNFFGPINDLLDRFGARKVFVEGDAVILCIYEYQDAPHDWLAICRAGGLARKILEVVDAQNAQNRQYKLPDLELGMGIAFLGEAPAFLYDGDHEIMISAAINRADRLSSCAASLRETHLGRELPRGVEVVAPVNQGIMQKDSGDNLLRYNVNGIELDPAAFPKLQQELALHKLEAQFPQYGPGSVFHVGCYPDKLGMIQWLAVREAPVRLWIGNEVRSGVLEGRKFYEIVTDPEVVGTLRELLPM